jgi:hypothetical protein
MTSTYLLMFLLTILFSLPGFAKTPDADCVNWFNSTKVIAGTKDCDLKCATLMTDMGTFMCPDQCEELCKQPRIPSIPNKLIYYPGLNPSEKKLVEQYPKEAITAFIQKTRAEWASDHNFPTQELNDEGDAFRHFIWAGLLTKELGKDQAMKFLNAHEDNRLQPADERAMDNSNNQSGIHAAQNLISEKKFNIENLKQKALDDLREKRLEVISPGLPIPKEPQ